MAIIHELSPHMADLIAAGEVVERPASVAKELIENSIDAGSTSITIEIQNGGITYLRIADNGSGISSEDAPIAFKRHATSKIHKEDDLSAIGTLGFRGEALAAIASVSRISLFTKQTGAIEGTHIDLEAGIIYANEIAGCPEGTTFIIRDLFYNTPARMKFLKKDFTEANYILSVVQHAALSNPEVAFKCIKDGKTVFNTPGTGELFSAVFSVFGKELSSDLIEADLYELNRLKVWGFISKPHASRANRSMQHFFVNGRYVKSRLIQAALEEAYKNRLITGKYPYGCIYISLPYSMVDVNVHPTKTEVKFANEKDVFDVVYAACKNALAKDENIPQFKSKVDLKKSSVKEDNITQEQQLIRHDNRIDDLKNEPKIPLESNIQIQTSQKPLNNYDKLELPLTKSSYLHSDDSLLKQDLAIKYTSSSEPKSSYSIVPKVQKLPEIDLEPDIYELIPKSCVSKTALPKAQIINTVSDDDSNERALKNSNARIIGECFNTYIVAEDKDGLIFIDKHAAHERIIFNKLRSTTEIPTQILLTPVVSDFSREEFSAILEGLSSVQKIGFDIEPFGEQSFIVRQVPAYIDGADISVTLSEIAQKLMDKRSPGPDKLDDLIHTVSCKAAIKAGTKTNTMELSDLLNRVLSDPEVTCCPHGRPVTVRLTKYEMDKLFKRVNQ